MRARIGVFRSRRLGPSRVGSSATGTGAGAARRQYLLYQTLVGAWPIETERVKAYIEKAAREAKARTSWTAPQAAYETALQGFVDTVLADETFRRELESFVATVRDAGRTYSLGQVLLKLTCPGVPDIYQGTELWDLSLVDPDNRRPVDFALRHRRGRARRPSRRMARRRGCRIAIARSRARRRSDRQPTLVVGAGSQRGVDAGEVVTCPSLVPPGEWGDTRVLLPAGAWRNELTGEEVAGGPAAVGRMLAAFPVALLSRTDPIGRSGSGRAATTAG